MKNFLSFTLIETLLAIGIASVILASSAGLYLMAVKASKKSRIEQELAQNGRIAAEKITREIRQTSEIASILPEIEPAIPYEELIIRDALQSEEINYIKYYLDSGKLRRQEGFYYFSFDENKNHVAFNISGPSGETPLWNILNDEIAAENFIKISFFGYPLVKMRFTLSKAEFSVNFASAVLGRNIN